MPKTKIKICDDLWAACVKKIGECEYCHSKEDLQAHHIIPRTKWGTRYVIENGVCLCKQHHLYWAHKDAMGFVEWIKTKRDYKQLMTMRNNTSKHDYALIKIYLTNILHGKEHQGN